MTPPAIGPGTVCQYVGSGGGKLAFGAIRRCIEVIEDCGGECVTCGQSPIALVMEGDDPRRYFYRGPALYRDVWCPCVWRPIGGDAQSIDELIAKVPELEPA